MKTPLVPTAPSCAAGETRCDGPVPETCGDGQWTRGKGFDTFCPVGPYIVPRDEVNLSGLRVRTFVDGEMKQDAALAEMIFSVNDIIAHVSAFMTLEPGDLIATGTPSGVGPMQVGSLVRVEIEGIGAVENTVILEDQP